MFAATIGFYVAAIATARRHHAVAALGLDKVISVIVAIVTGELHDADAVRILEFAFSDADTVGCGIHCRH